MEGYIEETKRISLYLAGTERAQMVEDADYLDTVWVLFEFGGMNEMDIE